MGLVATITPFLTMYNVPIAILVSVIAALFYHIIHTQYFHPLAKFPGPWYATSFSIVGALISVWEREPEFFRSLVDKYGRSQPIRISPTTLFFPRASALRDIYWSAPMNTKSPFYNTGALGPPQLFSTINGEEHRKLRKALSNAPWTIGQLKRIWEPRFDDMVQLFISKMREHADAKRTVCLSDKVAEFAADIMSMITFTEPLGCVKNQRDEKAILENWRTGLVFFGFTSRWNFFRDVIIKMPVVGDWFLPDIDQDYGMGWLMGEADRQLTEREKMNAEKPFTGEPDFMQHCIDARFSDGSPLSRLQRRAHVTLLIQAGADTTATAMGCILRLLVATPGVYARAHAEIERADKSNLLSTPVQYEEVRRCLPYFVACIREGLRIMPSVSNPFARTVPKEGRVIDGVYIPGGTQVTSHSMTLQRDKDMYGEDADEFRPERWMVSDEKSAEYEAAQFTFGYGSRICLGKDIALMEMYKLLPEIVRRFDIELVDEGKFIVCGGIAYNEGFMGKFVERTMESETLDELA